MNTTWGSRSGHTNRSTVLTHALIDPGHDLVPIPAGYPQRSPVPTHSSLGTTAYKYSREVHVRVVFPEASWVRYISFLWWERRNGNYRCEHVASPSIMDAISHHLLGRGRNGDVTRRDLSNGESCDAAGSGDLCLSSGLASASCKC